MTVIGHVRRFKGSSGTECLTYSLIGRRLRRLVPVANYEGAYPLNERQLREWALLDTFDWLAPHYDQPQTAETIRHWLAEAKLQDTEVVCPVALTGRGTKPPSNFAAGR